MEGEWHEEDLKRHQEEWKESAMKKMKTMKKCCRFFCFSEECSPKIKTCLKTSLF